MTTRLQPSSVTADGRHVAAVTGRSAGDDVMIVTLANGKSSTEPWLRTPHNEWWPEFSPDGRWLAYATDESGRFEVYVQPYPEKGARGLVSMEGGSSPAWHRSGRELFYVSLSDPAGKRSMMAVDFEPGTPPRIGTPRLLFKFDPRGPLFNCAPVRCYDVAPDGQHFFVVQTPTPPPAPVVTHINLIQNWFEELNAKVPVGK
jgi:eukaryotic-like serine/threonine-protein kinase